VRERVLLERRAAAVLERHIAEFQPDVVNWWGMGGMPLGLVERVRLAGIPAVGVVGDEWLVWGPRVDAWQRMCRKLRVAAPLVGRLAKLPATVDFQHAATWLFNSEEVKSRSLAAGPLADPRVEHPGIDDALFRPAPPRDDWNGRLLYLGRLDERKGVHVAIEALAWLPETTLKVQGRGDPAYVMRLIHRAALLDVLDRVEFTSEPRKRLPKLAGCTMVMKPASQTPLSMLRGGRRRAVPRPVGRAVGTRAARGDGGGPAGDRDRHRRLRRVPAPRAQLPALRAARRRR
jgi:glycosyltransferase involved in cell wall biosynthesis